MYIVEWDNREGNRHERTFDSLEDAQLEAASLKDKFDYVAIVTRKEIKTMKETNIQNDFLDQLKTERQSVSVITTNGFQLKGRITAYDQFTILVEDEHSLSGGIDMLFHFTPKTACFVVKHAS